MKTKCKYTTHMNTEQINQIRITAEVFRKIHEAQELLYKQLVALIKFDGYEENYNASKGYDHGNPIGFLVDCLYNSESSEQLEKNLEALAATKEIYDKNRE